MVAATQIKVTWRAEGGSDNQKIEGSKYTFRLDGSELTTEYDGEYFAINSMKNENETLALKLAKKYFPSMIMPAIRKGRKTKRTQRESE